MPPYIISTPCLGLRHWTDADVKPFIEMNMDADVMGYFTLILRYPGFVKPGYQFVLSKHQQQLIT